MPPLATSTPTAPPEPSPTGHSQWRFDFSECMYAMLTHGEDRTVEIEAATRVHGTSDTGLASSSAGLDPESSPPALAHLRRGFSAGDEVSPIRNGRLWCLGSVRLGLAGVHMRCTARGVCSIVLSRFFERGGWWFQLPVAQAAGLSEAEFTALFNLRVVWPAVLGVRFKCCPTRMSLIMLCIARNLEIHDMCAEGVTVCGGASRFHGGEPVTTVEGQGGPGGGGLGKDPTKRSRALQSQACVTHGPGVGDPGSIVLNMSGCYTPCQGPPSRAATSIAHSTKP